MSIVDIQTDRQTHDRQTERQKKYTCRKRKACRILNIFTDSTCRLIDIEIDTYIDRQIGRQNTHVNSVVILTDRQLIRWIITNIHLYAICQKYFDLKKK